MAQQRSKQVPLSFDDVVCVTATCRSILGTYRDGQLPNFCHVVYNFATDLVVILGACKARLLLVRVSLITIHG